jgi:hypothetical protein
MAKWIPHRHDGDQTPIEAKRFAHYVGTIQHWFAVHKNMEGGHGYTVSHWDSGYRVAHVPAMLLISCNGDAKAAAKLTITKLVEQHGESRVHRSLAGAPARKKDLPKAVADATI